MATSPNLLYGATSLAVALAFAIIFIAIMSTLALPNSLISLLALWPMFCYALLSLAYFTREELALTGAALFGKPIMFGRSHHFLATLLVLPLLLPLLLLDSASKRNAPPRGQLYYQISKGLFLGDSSSQFPEETTTIVDVCAEYSPKVSPQEMRCIGLPSLRGLAARPHDLYEVAYSLMDQMSMNNHNMSRHNSSNDPEGFGLRGRGTIYCFDYGSEGLERGTVFVCVLLVLRNECTSIQEALQQVKRAGLVHTTPNALQLKNAEEAVALWRESKFGASCKAEPPAIAANSVAVA